MKNLFLTFIIALVAVVCASNAEAQNFPFKDTTLDINTRVANLMSNLTLEEKIALLQHKNPAIERLGLKPYSWWNEALHGVARNGKATVYPMPIGMAATWDVPLIEQAYRAIAYEGRKKFAKDRKNGNYDDNQGITYFTPNINIFRDPRWGRGMETFGEDPWLTSQMGLAAVKGLQTKIGNNRILAAACLKHLAVHSGPEAKRHEFNVEVSQRDLWSTYLPAFEYIIRYGRVQQVMCAYNRLNGEPCCTNKSLLTDILRTRWHYDGILVTDCWALNDCWEVDEKTPRHRTHTSAAEAARDAFGNEVDLECGSGLNALKSAIDSSYIETAAIDRHVRRVLKTRLMTGIDDEPTLVPHLDNATPNPLAVAHESIVMLKNNGILPLCMPNITTTHAHTRLADSIHRLALLGPNIDDTVMALGNYNGDPINPITIKNAFENYAKSVNGNQFTLYCDRMNDLVGDGVSEQSPNMDKVYQCDAIVYVGGLSPKLEGEELDVTIPGFVRGDRTSIELPAIQVSTIKALKQKTGKPIVLVLCTGSAIALGEVEQYVDAIVVGWYGGETMGEALFEALADCAKEPLFGRLPVSFYASTSQLPPFEDYSMDNRTYRYFSGKVAYPFGYGLTYNTNRTLRSLRYNKQTHSVEGFMSVYGTPYEEVVQVYLKNPNDPKSARKTLVGFTRPGERDEVTSDMFQGKVGKHDIMFSIPINMDAFNTFDETLNRKVMPSKGSKYILQVGFSSDDKDLKEIPITY